MRVLMPDAEFLGGVDQPVGEVARERGAHQDPVVGAGVVERDEDHPGQAEHGLRGRALGEHLGMQVKRAALGQHFTSIRTAQSQGGALRGDVDRGAAVLAHGSAQLCLQRRR